MPRQRLREHHDLDERAAENLVAYLEDEREATGALPTDKRVVVERFRDELGDWRLTLLTPFGGRVHAPWSLAIESRLQERLGMEVQTIWSDDGIAIRMPEGEASLDGVEELLFPAAEDVEDLVVGQVANSALFASRFRENAARALLLPRRRPGTRTPLWQQRQRAADLLAVASRYGSFPILVETYRECLSDVFDLDALREILGGISSREIAVHGVETPKASPFASSLLFDYVAAYMYDGDTPLAERRAGALTLDRDLLRELLGQEELRELLDPDALADLELSLQALVEDRAATTLDQVHDLLRRLGDLSADEVSARTAGGAPVAVPWLAELEAARRAVRVRIAGDERWIAIEDVARYRDGVGVTAPVGVPAAFLGPAAGALEGLLARFARTHGPFLTPDPARRWGLPAGIVGDGLERLLANGSLLLGEFRPGGAEREWCDPDVLRLLRRRSLARLRREVEPVDPAALGRFLPAWHGVAPVGGPGADAAPFRGSAALERLAEVVDQLAGVAIPASVLERDVLPARVPGYQPRLLDELGTMGEVGWVGRGSLGRDDGRIALFRPGRDALRPVTPPDGAERPESERHDLIREHLARRGASFYREIHAAAGGGSDRAMLDALWDLVWVGEVTNDTFAPLRALRWKRPTGGNGARATAGSPDRARSTRGGGSMVARGTRDRADRHGTPARAGPRAAGTLRRADPRSGGQRRGRWRLRRRLPGPPRARGRRADPARLLRRRPGCRAVRAGGRARSTAGRPRTGRPPRGGVRPSAGRRRSGEPVRCGPALAPPRRGRPAAAPAGGRGVRRAGGRGGGAVPGARRLHAADPGAGRRSGRRRCGDPRAGRARGHGPRPRARDPQGRRPARRRSPVPRPVARLGLQRRLPRPRPARRPVSAAEPTMPEGDTLFRTAAGLRPYLVGRDVLAARAQGPGAVPQVQRIVGKRIDAVESQGKNLLIRFDGGLQIRTHLRMNGSWHRYRPGERWRRPPGRARLVLEVDGAVAVCFDAPVVELFETRSEPLHPSLSRLGPDLLAPDFDAAEAHRRLRAPERADLEIGVALVDQRALAGIGNVYKNEVLWIEQVSPFARVATLDDATLERLVATARRLMRANIDARRGPERVTTAGDRGAPGSLYVYGRTGRPCRRCGTAIAVARQGTDLPRSTYWCPKCQGPGGDA